MGAWMDAWMQICTHFKPAIFKSHINQCRLLRVCLATHCKHPGPLQHVLQYDMYVGGYHCCGRHQWQRRQPGGPGMSSVGVPSSISLSFGVASMLHQNPRCSCNGSRPITSSSRLLRTRAIHKLRNLWQCLHLCLREFKFWLFCWRCCAVERLHDFVSQCQCSIVTHARMFHAWWKKSGRLHQSSILAEEHIVE